MNETAAAAEAPTPDPIQIPENLYRIRLENYYGPLDLLLHLVREHELEIGSIPIATVADQYIAFIEAMQDFDMDMAGEFLVTAATLMLIKSRSLLPTELDDDEEEGDAFEEDPGFELIQRLLEYKKYKDRSQEMGRMAKIRARRFARPKIVYEDDVDEEDLVQLDLWEIVRNWARIAGEIQYESDGHILYSDIPIENFMAGILDSIVRNGETSLKELLGKTKDRGMIIGNFLALLELGKERKIRLEQTDDGGDIRILAPDEHQIRELEEEEAEMAGTPLPKEEDSSSQEAEPEVAAVVDEQDSSEEGSETPDPNNDEQPRP